MVKATCGQKVVNRKTTEKQKDMLDGFATANGVISYKCVLRKDDDNVFRVPLDVEVGDNRKQGRTKDLEEASERKRDLFQGECLQSSKMERWSANYWGSNGVNLTIYAKETTPHKNCTTTTTNTMKSS